MESACDMCRYFQTSIEFNPTLQRQSDRALAGQTARAALFDRLLDGVDADDD